MAELPSPRQPTAASRSFSALSDVTLGSIESHDAEDGAKDSPQPDAGVLDAAEALMRAGGWGRGQCYVVTVMGSVWVLMAASFSLPVFVAAAPQRLVANCPSEASQEKAAVSCRVGAEIAGDDWCQEAYRDSWEYARREELVTAEWDLICEDYIWASSVGSSFFFGVLGGNAVFAPVPDKIGRCRTFMIAGLLAALGAAVDAEAQSLSMYLAGRLWAGFGFGGLGTVAWIVASEVVDKEHQPTVMLAMNSMWACGIVLLTLLALVMPAWRALSKTLALGHFVVCILGFAGWHQGLESPQWLAAHGYADSFHAVMGWLARRNGRHYAAPLPVSHPPAPAGAAAAAPQLAAKEHGPDRCSDMICRQPVACWTGRFILAFCGCSLGYYGLSLNAGNLGGSVHVSTLLTGIVEIPALLAATKLADVPRIGRRGTVVGGLGGSGLFCLLSAALPAKSASGTAAAILGKLCVSSAFCTVIMQAGEAYPTTVRGVALGLFSTSSRFTGVLAPVVVMAPAPWPVLAIGGFLLLSCVLLLGLPETRGRPAAATLAEACESAGARQSGHGCCCGQRYRELEEEPGRGQAPAPAGQVEIAVIGRRTSSQP